MADSVTGEAEPVEPIASTIGDVTSGLAQIISNLQLIAVDLQQPTIAGPDNNAITLQSVLQSVAGALQEHALRLREMVDPVRSVLRPERFYQAGVVAAADEQYEKAAGF